MSDENHSFEAQLARLEALIQNMESNVLPLENLIASHQEGKQLLESLEKQLLQAEQMIKRVGEDPEEAEDDVGH